jgi:hypothetical protein
MKNLLIHISPSKNFCNKEHEVEAKIQIDNSLRLGWKTEDIILATNFKYEYKGIQSYIIEDCLCSHHIPATKIYAIVELFNKGLIGDGTYWYHDFDCFQLNPMDDPNVELGVTNYGRMPRLCSASIFFKKSARDIFERIKREVDETGCGEESRITNLAETEPRITKLNNTYAFQKWNMWHSYCRSVKPIKAVHFHLTPDKYDFFVRGNNRVNLKIIPEELVEIFHKYGFRPNNNIL